MEESILMVFLAILQGFGAYYALTADGVPAKMVGLLLCLTCLGCVAVSIVFYRDHIMNNDKEKEKKQ